MHPLLVSRLKKDERATYRMILDTFRPDFPSRTDR